MDPIPANELQISSIAFSVQVTVSPRPIDLAPDGAAGESQTHALASLTG